MRVHQLKTDHWPRVIQYWYNLAKKGSDHQGQEGIDEAERPLGKNWEARCVVNHVPPPCSTCWLPHNLTLDRGFTIVNTTVFYHPSPTLNNAHMAVSIHFFPKNTALNKIWPRNGGQWPENDPQTQICSLWSQSDIKRSFRGVLQTLRTTSLESSLRSSSKHQIFNPSAFLNFSSVPSSGINMTAVYL